MKLNRRNAARFRGGLETWAQSNLRSFPWRRERNRFRILLSELLLRRTRADQVLPVYNEAVRRYRSAKHLDAASGREVRKLLSPLGLRWRAENVIELASELVANYGGKVPVAREALISLTGVGEYVADAVECFSAGRAVAIIDTNVVRVLGRVFGLRTQGEARRRKELRDAAMLCLDKQNPRIYNYAILDFAAALCTANRPRCDKCPFGAARLCEFDKKRASAA